MLPSCNRYKKSDAYIITIEALLKVLPTKKSLVVSFWTFFSNFSATKENYKEPEPPKIFVDARVSF